VSESTPPRPELDPDQQTEADDTGVQMPAFAALIDELTGTFDGTLTRGARFGSPSAVFGSSGGSHEQPRLSVSRWSGATLRHARVASSAGPASSFAMSVAIFPEATSALPVLTFEYVVLRERLQLVALDLLDTDVGDDSWSRDQLRRARRILELPIVPPGTAGLPPWAQRALSSSAIVVAQPGALPAAGLVRRAAIGLITAYVSAQHPRRGVEVSAVSAARRAQCQDRFCEAMLEGDPALRHFRKAFEENLDELAEAVLFPRVR
jgi:hypothetical protein